jgi:hypothetical protein
MKNILKTLKSSVGGGSKFGIAHVHGNVKHWLWESYKLIKR